MKMYSGVKANLITLKNPDLKSKKKSKGHDGSKSLLAQLKDPQAARRIKDPMHYN